MKRGLTPGKAATLMVIIATALAVWSSWDDSPVVDEVPHIGAGYSYVKRWDMRLNPEHPPLVKDLAGLPLLALGLRDAAFDGPQWTKEVNGQWTFGRTLIFSSGENPDTVLRLARAPMLLFFWGMCWLVWRWMRERRGDRAALIAVTLLAFSPTVLAHARLVTTDSAAAFGVLAATYCFLRFLRAPGRGTFTIAAITLGIALLSKFNTVLLGPYFMLVALILDWRHVPRAIGRTALVGATALLFVVWPVYAAHTWNYPTERQATDTRHITASQGKNPLKTFAIWAADKPVIRGLGHWALGLSMVVQRNAGGNTIYWLGNVVKRGGPAYFPLVYLLKEPLAWWLLVALALSTLRLHKKTQTDELVWLLWLAIYWGVSMKSTLNIGIRHLLPVYPFAVMLVAGRLSLLTKKWLSVVVALLLGWYVFEAVSVHPHYLTYFNQLAGGPRGGYRYVVDSNLDWGQDAKRLGMFVRDRGIEKICVDYFGWADVGYYLGGANRWTSSAQWKNAEDFRVRNDCGGWLAVSATFLQNANGERTFPQERDHGTYRWLLEYQPATVVGNSIFVWHIE